MTVSKAIAKWLEGYEMKPVKVSTDQVGEGADSIGIFKSPNREKREYNDESYQITEYYQLFVVREGQENREREENDEWLENFAYWVDDCQYKQNFPELDQNRECQDIWISSTPYMFEARENNTALYQISLGIQYLRRREVKEEW